MAARRSRFSSSPQRSIAGRLWATLILLALLAVVIGGAFLATWDIPAPGGQVEEVIPDDRFAE